MRTILSRLLYHGLGATWGWTELTAIGLYKMIVGDISSKNIGGPLTIANISGEAASQGASSVIFLIAILSINLGVLNLLPIPILDGGHLLFFLIEGILRKPLGERQRELAQQAGLVLLVGVMIFAFWNDLERIFSISAMLTPHRFGSTLDAHSGKQTKRRSSVRLQYVAHADLSSLSPHYEKTPVRLKPSAIGSCFAPA